MEKLNIVWIKKWKIKRNLISVMTKIKAFFEKRNWNYVAIIAIIFGGAVVVYTSCWINAVSYTHLTLPTIDDV